MEDLFEFDKRYECLEKKYELRDFKNVNIIVDQ